MSNMCRKFRQLILLLLVFVCVLGIIVVVSVKHVMHRDGGGQVQYDKIAMRELEARNSRRIRKLEETCKSYNLGFYQVEAQREMIKYPPAPQYSVFYIDTIHKISYCPIYKAGSTTWLHNLCLLMNISETELRKTKDQISTIARRLIPEMDYPEAEEVVENTMPNKYPFFAFTTFRPQSQLFPHINFFIFFLFFILQAMRDTTKFLVVRHPFERLLSAYRDKLENSMAGREHGTLHFYRKYGATIVQKYRDDSFIPPREDQVIHREGVSRPTGIEPTWREFVEYLIDTDLGSYGDDHWMPYYLYCTPCSVNYTIIAKVETLNDDQTFAIQRMGLASKIKPMWRHSGGQSDASSVYFSQLTPDHITQLYEKFKLDFEMFDYTPDSYYQYSEDI
ncbi:carbohydrate sulfotransferase 11-like isoform X1 [Diachasmimorpha longicaudata]|uniref:carbohydrate sulfotransferase 11-like isoform X1 n=1 Tax=Diachasmimorpha longicaudata TaxID=58733 RepID=UPI0030B893CB